MSCHIPMGKVDREFTFLRNAKQLSALDVANLYKKKDG